MVETSGLTFIKVRTGPGNPGKFLRPWKSLETLEKPWNFFYEALENLTELCIEKNKFVKGAFSGLNNKHLKSLAIRASDCQDLLAQIQRVLARPEIERSPIQIPMVVFLRAFFLTEYE